MDSEFIISILPSSFDAKYIKFSVFIVKVSSPKKSDKDLHFPKGEIFITSPEQGSSFVTVTKFINIIEVKKFRNTFIFLL